MSWPHDSEGSPGNAGAAFRSACQNAGIDTHLLSDSAAMQLALANILSLVTATGGLAPQASVTFSNAPTSAVSYNLGMAVSDFGLMNTVTGNNPIVVDGTTDVVTLLHLTLSAFGGGTGVVSVGAVDSGGAGFRLLRVPN